jgi:hypothetical protein
LENASPVKVFFPPNKDPVPSGLEIEPVLLLPTKPPPPEAAPKVDATPKGDPPPPPVPAPDPIPTPKPEGFAPPTAAPPIAALNPVPVGELPKDGAADVPKDAVPATLMGRPNEEAVLTKALLPEKDEGFPNSEWAPPIFATFGDTPFAMPPANANGVGDAEVEEKREDCFGVRSLKAPAIGLLPLLPLPIPKPLMLLLLLKTLPLPYMPPPDTAPSELTLVSAKEAPVAVLCLNKTLPLLPLSILTLLSPPPLLLILLIPLLLPLLKVDCAVGSLLELLKAPAVAVKSGLVGDENTLEAAEGLTIDDPLLFGPVWNTLTAEAPAVLPPLNKLNPMVDEAGTVLGKGCGEGEVDTPNRLCTSLLPMNNADFGTAFTVGAGSAPNELKAFPSLVVGFKPNTAGALPGMGG